MSLAEASPIAEKDGPENLPFISVVIPVRNEGASLPGLLELLTDQDYPNSGFEIIVADGISTDNTAEIVAEFAKSTSVPVRLVSNSLVRSGPGRNAGVRASRGEVILFVDGHCIVPSRQLLRDTARLLVQTGVSCLCRPQPLHAPTSSAFGKVVANVRGSWLGHGRDSLIYNLTYSGIADPTTSGATYRRELFEVVGFYDETFDACEDCDFNLRVRKAGYIAYTDPSLAVYYEPRGSFSGLWKQMVRYGRGRIRLMRKHPDYVSFSQFAPLILLLVLGFNLPALILPGVFWLITSLPLMVFAALVSIASIQLSTRHGVQYLWQAPLAFLCIYIGLGAGMLVEGLFYLRYKFPVLNRLYVR